MRRKKNTKRRMKEQKRKKSQKYDVIAKGKKIRKSGIKEERISRRRFEKANKIKKNEAKHKKK
jgi:hypothetical protein